MWIPGMVISGFRQRPGRTALTLASIAIAVAAATAVAIATSTTRSAYRGLSQSAGGAPSLEVVSSEGGTFEPNSVGGLASVPGVRTVEPQLHRPSILRFQGQRVRVVVLGLEPAALRPANGFELAAGQGFGTAAADPKWQTVLEEEFARGLGVRVGDQVLLLSRRGPLRFTVVGLVKRRSFQGAGSAVLVPLAMAQDAFFCAGKIDIERLVLDDGAQRDEVLQRVEAALPAGFQARAPVVFAELSRQTTASADLGLDFALALSIAMAVFIISNTFLMNVSERRRQLAILRAVGATRGQIIRLLLTEALVLGSCGTLLGAALGIGSAMALGPAMARLLQMPTPALHWSAGSVGLAILLGPAMSLVAAFLPARQAGRISPLEGMTVVVNQDGAPFPRGISLAGLALWLCAVALLTGIVGGYVSPRLSIPAGMMMLLSFIAIVPMVLGPLGRAVGQLLRPWCGIEADMAQRQVLRRRMRTALTISVMIVAITNCIGTGNAILNVVGDIHGWYHRIMQVGNFFLAPTQESQVSGATREGTEAVERELTQTPGVTAVDTIRYLDAQAAGSAALLIVRAFPPGHELPFELTDATPDEVRSGLATGSVVLGNVLAQKLGLGRGGELLVETGGVSHRLPIAAITNDYMVGGQALYMQRAAAEREFDITGVDLYLIRADQNAHPEVAEQLRALAARQHLLLQTFTDLVHFLDNIMNGVIASFWALLAIGFIVALLAIGNTLTMNVLEQTRELGLLRVVGMTRTQIRRHVLVQAAMLGGIGLAMGVLSGVTSAYVINLCLGPLIGHTIAFILHPRLLVIATVATLGIAVISALIPARRAAQLDLLEALAYE